MVFEPRSLKEIMEDFHSDCLCEPVKGKNTPKNSCFTCGYALVRELAALARKKNGKTT